LEVGGRGVGPVAPFSGPQDRVEILGQRNHGAGIDSLRGKGVTDGFDPALEELLGNWPLLLGKSGHGGVTMHLAGLKAGRPTSLGFGLPRRSAISR